MTGISTVTLIFILFGLIILIFSASYFVMFKRYGKDAAAYDPESKQRGSIFFKLSSAVIGIVVITLILSSIISIFAIKRVHSFTERINTGFANGAADLSEAAMIADLEDQVGDQLSEKIAYVNEAVNSYMDDAVFLQSYMNDIYKNADNYHPLQVSDVSMDMAGRLSLYKLLANKDIRYEEEVKEEAEYAANIVKLFKPLKHVNSEYVDLYVATETGVLISYDDFAEIAAAAEESERFYEFRSRDWYRQAKNDREIRFISRYVDSFIKGNVTTCAIPFYDGKGDFAGCVGMDIYTDNLYQTMVNSNISDNMEAYVVESSGRILASKDMEEGTADTSFPGIEELKSKLDSKGTDETVIYTVDDNDGKCYIGASYIRHTDWIFVVKAPMESYTRAATEIRSDIGNSIAVISKNFDMTIQQVINHCLVIFAFLLVLASVFSAIQSLKVIKPVRCLEKDVMRFSKGDLSHRTRVDTRDEIGDLARSFNGMAASIQQYMETIKLVTAKEERIATELSMAKDIQTSLLPNNFPAFPDRQDFDIYASMDPAKVVGGDFYDFFLVDEDHLAIVMADVSGKGVPASLFMVVAKTLIKTHAYIEDSPEKIFSFVNKVICENNQDDMFVTAWLGILDLKTGLVKAVNAGHEYPAMMLPGKRFSLYKDVHTVPVGCMDGISFKQYEFMLPPGSKLYLYTDGVTEATNKEEKLFGTDRMMEALNKVYDKTPEEILSFMKKSINEFVGEAPQFDDFTMLCVQFNGISTQKGGKS